MAGRLVARALLCGCVLASLSVRAQDRGLVRVPAPVGPQGEVRGTWTRGATPSSSASRGIRIRPPGPPSTPSIPNCSRSKQHCGRKASTASSASTVLRGQSCGAPSRTSSHATGTTPAIACSSSSPGTATRWTTASADFSCRATLRIRRATNPDSAAWRCRCSRSLPGRRNHRAPRAVRVRQLFLRVHLPHARAAVAAARRRRDRTTGAGVPVGWRRRRTGACTERLHAGRRARAQWRSGPGQRRLCHRHRAWQLRPARGDRVSDGPDAQFGKIRDLRLDQGDIAFLPPRTAMTAAPQPASPAASAPPPSQPVANAATARGRSPKQGCRRR